MPRRRAPATIERLLPGIRAGSRFNIQPGSKVGKIRLRGAVTVEDRSAHGATIVVECRILGVRSHGSIEVALGEDGLISIDVHGLPFLSIGIVGAPESLASDRLLLAIEPSATLEVEAHVDSVQVCATGLRIGAIEIMLVPGQLLADGAARDVARADAHEV